MLDGVYYFTTLAEGKLGQTDLRVFFNSREVYE